MCRSFANDVLPLFRLKDINCMRGFGVLLDSFDYMSDAAGNAQYADHGNARDVLARVDGTVLPRMPMGAPSWTVEQIGLLRGWIDDGCLA